MIIRLQLIFIADLQWFNSYLKRRLRLAIVFGPPNVLRMYGEDLDGDHTWPCCRESMVTVGSWVWQEGRMYDTPRPETLSTGAEPWHCCTKFRLFRQTMGQQNQNSSWHLTVYDLMHQCIDYQVLKLFLWRENSPIIVCRKIHQSNIFMNMHF